jgi:hypothetical protein
LLVDSSLELPKFLGKFMLYIMLRIVGMILRDVCERLSLG